jgi:hypothetical protein
LRVWLVILSYAVELGKPEGVSYHGRGQTIPANRRYRVIVADLLDLLPDAARIY